MEMNLQEKVRSLPQTPGVYLMKNTHGQIIYVGKAKKLRNRVQSYFRNSKNHSPKVEKLVKHLKDFDYILTDTEFEALMLECRLIKEIQPMYNRLMKNPQSFIYVAIDKDKEYKKIEIAHQPTENDGKLYFGPYTRRSTVEKAIHGIKECLKIDCGNPIRRDGACLNYSLGSCIGICLGGEALQQYNEIIGKLISFLNREDITLLKEMQQLMLAASESYDFEAASKYRDTIQAMEYLSNKEEVIEFTEANNRIVMIDEIDEYTVKLFFIKRTTVLFDRKYSLEKNSIEQLVKQMKAEIITYFRHEGPNASIDVSKNEMDEAQIIYSYLKSGNCRYFIIPERWLEGEDNEPLYRLLGVGEELG